MSLQSAQLEVKLAIRDQIDAGITTQSNIPVNIDFDGTNTYTPGTTANCCNKSAYYSGTLVATTVSIDLSALVVSTGGGGSGFNHIRSILIVNMETTDGHNLTVGGAGSNPLYEFFSASTGKSVIMANGRWLAEKPLGTIGFLTDTTHKILLLDSGANTVQYEMFVMGD
ncbi:MAG: hypothetical protein JWN86_1776 [Planctomycetota bacterium]|nr:hypothetical protein [Planctomycetota bacterium]